MKNILGSCHVTFEPKVVYKIGGYQSESGKVVNNVQILNLIGSQFNLKAAEDLSVSLIKDVCNMDTKPVIKYVFLYLYKYAKTISK